MAYEFKKLGEVEALESVPEGANALIETNGEIKRVPGSNLGGGGGIKTAILVMDAESMEAETQTATCSNMTYDEAKATLAAGEPLNAILTISMSGMSQCASATAIVYASAEASGLATEVVGLMFAPEGEQMAFYWTADGISTAEPTA